MSRLRELGQDAAHYFGFGEGSEPTRQSEQSRPTWTTVALGVLPVLVVALPVGRIIGLGDDFIGFIAQLALVGAVAAVWGWVLLLMRGDP